ncbi:MAG: hypothetical protein HUK03_10180, partial [Bacteroidaceae bacterium]|nr:hypothetical protein [Bacteroidaceae bacterium]
MKKLLLTLLATCFMALASPAQVTFTCTAGQDYGNNEGCQKAFDHDKNTKWCKAQSDASYALFTASQPVYVWGYEFTTANDNESFTRLVRGWKLYATNDAYVASKANSDEWIEISAWENSCVQSKNFATFRFFVEDTPQAAYKYFKLVITKMGGNLFQISEFNLCYNIYGNVKYNYWECSNDRMKKTVDKDINTKAEGNGNDLPDGSWVTLETADGRPHFVESYSMTTQDDGSWNNRAPNNWIVEGSNDNATWTTIDEVTNDPLPNLNFTTTQFTPANRTEAFRYVRLTLRSFKGSYHQLAEFFVNAGCSTPHNWEQISGKPAGCGKPATDLSVCSVCGAEKYAMPEGEHDFDGKYCTVCGRPDPSFFVPVEGYYQLTNTEQIIWLGKLFSFKYEDNTGIKVKLMNDLDLNESGFSGFDNGKNAKE